MVGWIKFCIGNLRGVFVGAEAVVRAKRREDRTEFGGLRAVWLEAFVKSVEARSRVAAATQMGVDQATVTKHIGKLERWLGQGSIRPLVSDNVWPLHLTAAGKAFLPDAVKVLKILHEARLPLLNEHDVNASVETDGASSSDIVQGEA